MKTRLYVAVTVLATAAAFNGCKTPGAPTIVAGPLHVTSFSPDEGDIEDDGSFRIRFDQPVAGEDEVGRSLPEPPVALLPEAKVAAMWDDRQTLVVTPVDGLTPSTRYVVALRGPLTGRIEADLSFVHKPLEVTEVFGFDTYLAAVDQAIGLRFNQDVRFADVEHLCAIESDADKARVPVSVSDADLVGAEIAVRPSRKLGQGVWYTLSCEGLSGAAGDVPMNEAYELRFRTYPPFEVLAFGPTGSDVWSDEVPIELSFSTPVDAERLRAALRTDPAIPGVEKGAMSSDGTEYRVVVDLRSSTDYTISVDQSFADAFGQKPAAKTTWTFTTGSARPRLAMETGIYAIEAGVNGGAYPVWTRNLSKVDVHCAGVPEGKVVGLLTGSMNYDPWYDAGDDELDWKALGLKRKKAALRIKEAKDQWHLEQLDLGRLCGGKRGGGLYLAELSSDEIKPDEEQPWRYHPTRRVLANVTDLGVLVKAGSASGVVWVTSLAGGSPVGEASVSIYTPRGDKVFTGATDADGILRIPGADALLSQAGAGDKDAVEDEGEYGYDEYDTWRSRRLLVVVRKGEDMAVVDGNWANGIQIWNFGVPADYRGGQTRLRGFILSDRGIYRPGEKVHFKGLIREISLNAPPSVPEGEKVSVQIEDSRGTTLYQRRHPLSEYGGFAFDLALGAEAVLGDYHVTATVDGQVFRESFIVEEFRKVTYELELDTAKRHTDLGKRIGFDLSARYLFGAPVAGADVEWQVSRRRHYLEFPSFAEYTFADEAANGQGYWWWDNYDDSYSTFVSDGSGVTDPSGRYSFAVRDDAKSLDGPQDYLVSVTARDATGEAVSERSVVTAHRSDAYVGLHAQEWVQAVGMPFSVNTIAVTPKGERVGLEGTLSWVRARQVCTHQGGYRSYPTCTTEHEKVWSRAITIPATGNGAERIMPKEPGEYVVRLEAKDARGVAIAASRFIWVLGKGEAFWSGDESARMSLVASKSQYAPGEVARLAPRSSLGPSTALVTLERNGIIDAFVKEMGSSGQGIEIPIEQAHAPNLFASVAMVKGRTGEGDRARPRFQMGVVELKVSTAHQRIEVVVETDRESYEPGEKVTGRIRTLSNGRPVDAEVCVSVADEGVLQLIGYRTPDPMAEFYRAWGLGVDSATNLNRIARLNDPRETDPDEGGDSGDGGGGPDVRSRFVSSAFWASALLTGEDGVVELAFDAPDNLTAFRVMAVAADRGARFGSGERRFTVKKPLLARPLLPRFFGAGDTALVGVDVRNLTGSAGEATVTARVRGGRLARTVAKVKLPADAAKQVLFPFTAASGGVADLTFSVEMAGHDDALRMKIPIGKQLLYEKRALSRGRFEGTVNVPLALAPSAVAGESRLEVMVDRTGMAELGPGLAYLIEYPYGCLEQTLSRLIPLLKVEDLARSLDLEELRGPKLKQFIRLGVDKVIRHQHEDGGFSLWPGGATYPHLTVYALFGLNEARRSGIKVDQGAIDRGVAALRAWVNGASTSVDAAQELGTTAQAAYVLAELGQPDAGLNARLFEKRAGLPIYGKAFLMSAIHMAGGGEDQVAQLKADLLARLRTRDDGALCVRETEDLRRYMSSDTRSTAIVMSALLGVDPSNEAIEGLSRGLLADQRPGGHWRSTQENLYALVALADYARAQAKGSVNVAVFLDEERLASKRLAGNEVLSLTRPLTEAPGRLRIETDGPARHTARVVVAKRIDGVQAKSDGFAITRQYVDPESGAPVSSLKVGDLVRVLIKVETPEDRNYVAVTDPLPAGLEAVNTRLATSVEDDYRGGDEDRFAYWRPGWTYRELRDDRVMAFADAMDAGSMELAYLARAITPGSFTAAPATVEAMYEPEKNGRTATVTVEVSR